MEELTLKIVHGDGSVATTAHGEDEVNLFYDAEYKPGDVICLDTSNEGLYIVFQPDDALGSSQIYVPGKCASVSVPFAEKRCCYSPKAFTGEKHYLYARVARQEEIDIYRNLAVNVADQHGDNGFFPHASANVETRDEAVFAARNAIDGVVINSSHGIWPYASWGINRDPNACLKLEFGREVEVDKIVLYTRADFPHDSWWTQATFTFSDGSTLDFPMEKSTKPHICTFPARKSSWLTFNQLIKAEDASPFPALTQIEVYGRG